MILVLGDITVRDDCIAEALQLSQEHVTRSRAEPGCIAHAVHLDSENPSRLVFVEKWACQADLALHFQVPASQGFVKALSALATSAPNMEVFAASPVHLQ